MVTQEEITITNITKLPSESGIAAEIRGISMTNIYAPSAREGREQFFDSELAYLLSASPTKMIVGGDCNCILHQKDRNGHFNYRRALDELVHGFELRDMWQSDPPENGYIIPLWERQEDRIYTTKLNTKKVGVETVAAALPTN